MGNWFGWYVFFLAISNVHGNGGTMMYFNTDTGESATQKHWVDVMGHVAFYLAVTQGVIYLIGDDSE